MYNLKIIIIFFSANPFQDLHLHNLCKQWSLLYYNFVCIFYETLTSELRQPINTFLILSIAEDQKQTILQVLKALNFKGYHGIAQRRAFTKAGVSGPCRLVLVALN